jgi:hypothetical protein
MPCQEAHRIGTGVPGGAENADLLQAHGTFLSSLAALFAQARKNRVNIAVSCLLGEPPDQIALLGKESAADQIRRQRLIS